jgi:hypothetical protein
MSGPLIEIGPNGGRIGPFWWLNANTARIEMRNATYNGSLHYVWREGVSGWGPPGGKRILWRLIK